MMVAVICLGTSCGSKKSKEDDPKPEQTAKYLTQSQFQNSSWKGTQSISTTATLVVTASDMTLTYFEKESVAKNTDDKFKQVTVKISPYTFDESTGKFSGTGNDNGKYEGLLTSTSALKITFANGETVSMNKQ